MDVIDKEILNLLQKDGRITHAQIGEKINLPTSTVNDRIRRLQKFEIVKGMTVKIDPIKIKLNILAYISVLIDWDEANEDFGIAVKAIPEIVECHHVTGDWSYLLKVRARNNTKLEELISSKIKAFPGVTRSETVFVLNTVKETTELPLSALK